MIRRCLAIAATLLAVTTAAHAESHYQPHVSVGGHGGVAMSRMSFAPGVDQGWFMGPSVGVHARYAEEKLFGIIGEINFTQRGWKETFDDNPDLRYSRSLSYISIPIMTHISFGSPRFKGFVNLGPEFGFMIADNVSANFDYRNPGSLLPPTRHVNQMAMDISNHFDYGITAGIGAEYYVNPRNSAYIECRFYYGLGNIFPSSKADEFSASRSMTVAATIGYSFRLR